jgi:general secretion pathway protein B
MSFILDALRKSEHDRQRAAMPGIAQVPFGLPRRELPPWAIAVIVVLAIALLALAGAWWSSSARDSVDAAAPPASARTEIPLALPPAAVAAPPVAVYSAPPASDRGVERSTAADAGTPAPDTETPVAAARPREALRAEPGPAAAESARSDEPTVPSAEALAAEGITVPTLRLQLHAYSEKPGDRFVFINGTKYLEGSTLAEGPRLVSITPNGAVLSYLGRRFQLAPQ